MPLGDKALSVLFKTARLSAPLIQQPFVRQLVRPASTMTTGVFRHIDLSSHVVVSEPFIKPWGKVDDGGRSYGYADREGAVQNIRGRENEFGVDVSGFQVYESPAKQKAFTDDAEVREQYYPEVEALLKEKLQGVKKVVIFDHTIRRNEKASPRQPVQSGQFSYPFAEACSSR